MSSPKSHKHCPIHGYNILHVLTRHGWKCWACIRDRKRAAT